MFLFEEIIINKVIVIRKYMKSSDPNIELNKWQLWVKYSPSMRKYLNPDIDPDEVTSKPQGDVPSSIIPKVKEKYGSAIIRHAKGKRKVDVQGSYRPDVDFEFDFKRYLINPDLYVEKKHKNIFDIDTSTLPKNKFGIPILPDD